VAQRLLLPRQYALQCRHREERGAGRARLRREVAAAELHLVVQAQLQRAGCSWAVENDRQRMEAMTSMQTGGLWRVLPATTPLLAPLAFEESLLN
jgi:hypothetical protein